MSRNDEPSQRLIIRAAHPLIGSQLILFSVLIEQYPYGLARKALARFETYQDAYNDYYRRYQQGASPAAELARDCLKMQMDLNTDLRADLSASVALSSDEAITTSLISLQETVRKIEQLATRIEMKRQLDIKAIEMEEQTLKIALESSLAALKQAIQQRKALVLEKLPQQRLRNPQFWERLNISPKNLEWAKWQQHALVLLRNRLNTLKPWLSASQPVEILLPNHWLAKEEYLDWMTILRLVQPPHRLAALENQKAILAENYRAAELKAESLRGVWGEDYPNILRAQTILSLYQRWQSYFNSVKPRLSAMPDGWQKLLGVQRLLSYEKKQFFQKFLMQAAIGLLISRLYRDYQEKKPTAEAALSSLYTQKSLLSAELEQQEAALQTPAPRWKRWTAMLMLTVTQQPDFQLGLLASRATTQQLDRHSPWAVLKEPLPPEMANKLNHAVGFSFLGISLFVTNYAGYYYHTISAVNRALFAQITPMLRIAGKGGNPNSRFWRWRWCKQIVRCDELSLLGKEHALQWMNGLLLNALMSSQPLLAGFLGYATATASSQAAAGWMERLTAPLELSPELRATVQFAIMLLIYAQAYRQGLQWGFECGLYPDQRLSQADALSRLGLTAEATPRELSRRYRELSKQYHPDKCPTPECARQMIELNEAHALFKFH